MQCACLVFFCCCYVLYNLHCSFSPRGLVFTEDMKPDHGLESWSTALEIWDPRDHTPEGLSLLFCDPLASQHPSLCISRMDVKEVGPLLAYPGGGLTGRLSLGHKMGKWCRKSIPKIIPNVTDYIQWLYISAKLQVNLKTAPNGTALGSVSIDFY